MAIDPQQTSDQVLSDLAKMVGAMADSTLEEAAVLQHVVSGHKTYVAAVRAILTGKPIPPEPNPGEGGPINMPVRDAAGVADALGQNSAQMVSALANRTDANADQLNAVTAKEQEEKTGKPAGGGTGTTTAGTQPGGTQPGGAQSGGTQSGPGTSPGTAGGTDQGGGPGNGGTLGPDTTPGQGTTGKTPGSATTPGSTAQPVQQPGDTQKPPPPPLIVSKSKKRKFCWKFRIRNTTGKPVSDAHMFTPVTPDFPTDGTAAPKGWQPLHITGTQGFGYQIAKNNDGTQGPPIPPGQISGEFRFCADQEGFQAKTYLTHPDAKGNPSDTDRTEIRPENIDVNGKPGVRREDGTTGVPPVSREYVYQVTFDTGKDGGNFIFKTSDAVDVKMIDAKGAQVTSTNPNTSDSFSITGTKASGQGTATVPAGPVPVDGNTQVTITLTSPNSSLSGAIVPAAAPEPDKEGPPEQKPLQPVGSGTGVSW